MKQFILLVITLMCMDITQAQTDEDFLAEVFFDYMDEKSDKVYVDIDCGISSMNFGRYDIDYKIFSERLGIFDTTIVNELYDYYDNVPAGRQKWNTQAPVFQTSKYKKLKFIDGYLAGRKKETLYIAKPLFTKNREYALVSQTFYSYHKLSWKYRLKNGWKTKYEVNVAGYNILFKKEDGKWIEVGRYLTLIS